MSKLNQHFLHQIMDRFKTLISSTMRLVSIYIYTLHTCIQIYCILYKVYYLYRILLASLFALLLNGCVSWQMVVDVSFVIYAQYNYQLQVCRKYCQLHQCIVRNMSEIYCHIKNPWYKWKWLQKIYFLSFISTSFSHSL